MLLLLLSRFSRVLLCATPKTAAHQAPPFLGFSRQEHWSGLPFPSPMHESKKWKWTRSVVSDSSQPHGLQPTRLLCAWESPGNKYARIYQFIRKQKSESCIFIYLLLISSLIPAPTNLFFTFLILLFQECHINGMIYYEAFVDWLFTQHTSLEIHPGCWVYQ